MARSIRRRIGRIKGAFCSTNKKAVRAYACANKIKCRPVKIGKAIIAGKANGVIWCCGKRKTRAHRPRVGAGERASRKGWRFF